MTLRAPQPLWRQVVTFVVVFAALQLSWQWLQGSRVQIFLVNDLTVRSGTMLVNWLTPAVHAQAVNSTILSIGGGLNIINGCEGVEALCVLVAAFAVAPISWHSRGLGVLCGLPFVFVVNEARILALFYAHRDNTGLFDLLHGTVTPAAVILLVCAYFYAWLRSASNAAAIAR